MTPEQQTAVEGLLRSHAAAPGGLLPLLHAVQDQLGYLPPAAVPLIASAFNRTRAEIEGVISFYHDFHTEPPARHTLRLCRAEACQCVGGEALAAELRDSLGLPDEGVSADGELGLIPVYCLGACACAPALELDGRLHARVTPDKLRQLLQGLKGGEGAC